MPGTLLKGAEGNRGTHWHCTLLNNTLRKCNENLLRGPNKVQSLIPWFNLMRPSTTVPPTTHQPNDLTMCINNVQHCVIDSFSCLHYFTKLYNSLTINITIKYSALLKLRDMYLSTTTVLEILLTLLWLNHSIYHISHVYTHCSPLPTMSPSQG